MRSLHQTFLLTLPFLVSCSPGYQKENDNWAWVSYDEAVGKRVTKIDSVDTESFTILADKEYAKDKNHVYLTARIIPGADPNTFEVIAPGYSRDDQSVFLDYDKIVFANPKTFELIRFPYAKDDSHIFCGTIPLPIEKDEIIDFQITDSDKLGFGMKSSMTLSHFIESYPEYKWMDTVGVQGVIIGEWATGETNTKRFEGLKATDKIK
jgi:hypothetical protein